MPRRRFRTVSLAGPHPTHRLMNTMLVYNGQRAMGNRTSEWDFEMSGGRFRSHAGRGNDGDGDGDGNDGGSLLSLCVWSSGDDDTACQLRRGHASPAAEGRPSRLTLPSACSVVGIDSPGSCFRFRVPDVRFQGMVDATTRPHDHTTTRTHKHTTPASGARPPKIWPVDSYTHTRNSRVFYESNRRFVLNHPYISRV